MIDRICISINNRCNLKCSYCHFHEKSDHIEPKDMDILRILENVKKYISKYSIAPFKIGFVGNGEPFLDFDKLQDSILYILDELRDGRISAYTITNGTLLSADNLLLLKEHNVSVGFSIDGIKHIHDKLRCQSYDKVLHSIELYHDIYGSYPSMNCTVGRDVLSHTDETIGFFKQFDNRITFSRMIGNNGISLPEFRFFMEKAQRELNVRTGGYDCTMYGGKCGAGINNLYFANNCVYICGNCIDMPTPYASDTPIDEINFNIKPFDRNTCYKENYK